MSGRRDKVALRQAPMTPGLRFVCAVFDFTASVPEELTLKLGDVVKVQKIVGDFWLQGSRLQSGEIGQFPRDFVQDIIIPKHSSNETLLYALDTFYPQANGDLPFDKGDIVVLERKIDEQWGTGRCGVSARGMFPLNYTERLLPLKIDLLGNERHDRDVTGTKLEKNTPQGLGLARAIMALTAQLEEELSFCVGDEITILQVLDNGTWYKGRLGDDTGTFPASFVQLLTPLKGTESSKQRNSVPPVQRDRTGSKAWKEENLASVPIPNNITNNHNLDSGNPIEKNLTKIEVTDPSLHKSNNEISKEVPVENVISGAIHSIVATTDSTAVAEKVLYTVKAMHKFTGNTDQELSFDAGIEIPIFDEVDDHWLLGKVDDNEGYVPRAYVSRKHSTASEKEKSLSRLDHDQSTSRKKSDKSTNDENYVKAMGDKLATKQHVYSAPKSKYSGDTVNHIEANKPDIVKKAVAIFDYEARNKFDLTIFTDDTLWVLREVDENWVEVKNEIGKAGIVPTSYVQYVTGTDSRDTKPSLTTSEQRNKAECQPQVGAAFDNSYNSTDLSALHALCSTMPVLHEDAVTNGALADRNSRNDAFSSDPKQFVSPKPKTLPLNENNVKRQPHYLQKSVSVDSTKQDLYLGDKSTSINRSNSNPLSQYAVRARGTRSKLKAWQYARNMNSPTGPSTPPNERAIQAESESNTESDNSVSKKSRFSRTANRSASMREKRMHRRYEDTCVSKDTNFVKIRSDSDLRVEEGRPRSLMVERSRRLPKRSEHVNELQKESSSRLTWHADSSSTASTGSSSSYGETRASRSVHSDKSGSDASSATSMKSATSGRSIRRSAPPVPAHAHGTTPSTHEPPQNTVYVPSPCSPPVPQRKQSLQHEGRRRGGDAEALFPEIQRMARSGSLIPSRPAPELPLRVPPNQTRPAPVSNEGSSPRKKVPPMRPANPPHARHRDSNVRQDGGTQESVRHVTSRDIKDKIEKIRSDIEDYSRMKTDLENLYQGTLDGKERREISENMEFVRANLRRLQKEFHDLIEDQQDHTYESIEQYMIQPPQDGINSFEGLPPPPLPPTTESQGSIRIKRHERRLRVATELVETESDFLTGVTVTIEGIMSELIDRQVSQTTINTLFANIVQVKDFSEGLLRELEGALQNESSELPDYDGTTIGQVFIDNSVEIKEIYMPYYHNHDDAMLLLEKLQDDQEFMQAVNTCLDAIKSKVNVFDLGSFLIKPVQRFLKYPLLIEELIKLTDQSTRENPTDHDKLILAHKMMQDVAKEINEDKRVKDLVRKYKDASNEGLSEKLSKISIKASKKKLTRLSTKFGRAAGITTQEKRDSKFDVEERKFKMMERAAKLFVNNVTSYCDKCRDVLCAELTVAHAMVEMVVQPERSHPVAMYQSMADKMSGPLYRQFHDQVQLQVLSPVTSLIASFKSPQTIIDKRLDKLIDYERLQKHSDSKEKVEAAQHDYEALNKSLLDELPKLCDLGLKLLASCIAIFARVHRDFETKLLNELKPLLAIIQQSGSNEPTIPGNMETYERFRPTYQEAIQTISRLQVVPASFGALFGSSAKGSAEPGRRKSRTSARPPETSSTPKQPSQDRETLKKKYDTGQLYVAEKNYAASQLMDVSCCECDLVAVLKRQDPMGNTQRWFVNRGGPGNANGFLPSAILRPYDPVRDDALMAFNSPPCSSSPQPSTPTPAPRNKSPTPSTRSTSSAGSSNTSGGSTKNPLSPYMLRETLKRGILPSKEDGQTVAPLMDTDMLEAFAEEEEILDDDFVYGEVSSTGTSPKAAKQHFRAEYEFTARSELELTVRTGNIVKLIMNHDSEGNPEWWLVSNAEGKQGYVPSNYLTKAEYL